GGDGKVVTPPPPDPRCVPYRDLGNSGKIHTTHVCYSGIGHPATRWKCWYGSPMIAVLLFCGSKTPLFGAVPPPAPHGGYIEKEAAIKENVPDENPPRPKNGGRCQRSIDNGRRSGALARSVY
ncbi:unnamed protein product, partial [Laminaria digitata]